MLGEWKSKGAFVLDEIIIIIIFFLNRFVIVSKTEVFFLQRFVKTGCIFFFYSAIFFSFCRNLNRNLGNLAPVEQILRARRKEEISIFDIVMHLARKKFLESKI